MQQPLSGLPNISFIKKLPNKSKNLNHKFTQPFSQSMKYRKNAEQ